MPEDFYGLTARRLTEEYRLAKFQRGFFKARIKQEEKNYQKRKDGVEKRKQSYGVPKYERFEDLVADYIAGGLTSKEYFDQYRLWRHVYSDIGYERKLEWLYQEYEKYDTRMKYWQDMKDGNLLDRKMAYRRKQGKGDYYKELRRKHPYRKLGKRRRKNSKYYRSHTREELLLIRSTPKYRKRPWLYDEDLRNGVIERPKQKTRNNYHKARNRKADESGSTGSSKPSKDETD